MYRIIGADQKEYGPITADQLRQWITEGRVNPQTKVQVKDGSEWKLLADIPEFAEALKRRVPPVPAAAAAAPPKTSGMAIASLVLGVLGFCGITALIGLVLGIIALVKINRSQGRLAGNGLAIAGICVSGFMLLFSIPFMAGLTLPALARAKSKAQTINCVNNLKQLALAVRIYATDHNDQFPSATNWCDTILSNAGTDKIFKCPADDPGKRCHYAFNARLSGLEEGKFSPDTVMIFECDGGWNVNGGPELALTKPRHGRMFVVALADGSVQKVNESQFKQLRWEP